ncbi:beta-1,4-galactosyltransferase 2 [Garra rufa]|uniref:beta-1,4-galactosyltransferase 2 n=1 Tax=Garra rufa TaxID=137080 RepID=UPI003CCE83B9
MKRVLAPASQLAQMAEALAHRKLTVDSMRRKRHSHWRTDIVLSLRFPSSKNLRDSTLGKGRATANTSAENDWERPSAQISLQLAVERGACGPVKPQALVRPQNDKAEPVTSPQTAWPELQLHWNPALSSQHGHESQFSGFAKFLNKDHSRFPLKGRAVSDDKAGGSDHMGRLLIEFSSQITLERVQRENPNVTEGGKYTPPDCRPKQKVAIIIPFRHRDNHLKYWLHYLHPVLRRQKIDYGIYIINQLGEDTFNRAKLLNVGYTEALKDAEYDCFIFSDVDLIPMDDRNLYHCYDQPRHFAIAMDKFGFRLPYAGYFGGVSGLSKKQFLKINGFPNEYWGWGGEDDDIYNRITLNGMKVSRPDVRIGRYRMIKHERDKHNEPNPQRFSKIQNTKNTMRKDGISSLMYRVVSVKKYPLYTNISVEIGKAPPRPLKG